MPRTSATHVSDSDRTDGPSDHALAAGAALAGLTFDAPELALMRERVGEFLESYERVREVPLANGVGPALGFDPGLSLGTLPEARGMVLEAPPDVTRPDDLEETAFWPAAHLGALLRSGQTTSLELTEMYLRRLRRHGPALACVVTLTEDRARVQALRADEELAEGRDRGPLHGIPWGAKDLLDVDGFPTSWGAEPYRGQQAHGTATVVERLDAAGAVLVAKLSLGALAMGDWWYDGQTKNPWNPDQGSSGSSAGSAAAVAAGLVGFAIGSETMGSIVSPAARCAVVGLRPTFGRVSRHGAMALSWSMDKLGPMARAVEDCAAVLAAIHGPDGRDRWVRDAPFAYDAREASPARVGYIAAAFEGDHATAAHDRAVLQALDGAGVELVPVALPDYPGKAFMTVLLAEAAAAFDELTRTGRDDQLSRQTADSWPNLFRAARLVPAVEYIQANRMRELALRDLNALFEDVDVYLCPSTHPQNLYLTNATGHPTVAVPHAFDEHGRPLDTAMTFTAGLYREGAALAVARAYERVRPPLGRPSLDAR